jgi:hypothetical protein
MKYIKVRTEIKRREGARVWRGESGSREENVWQGKQSREEVSHGEVRQGEEGRGEISQGEVRRGAVEGRGQERRAELIGAVVIARQSRCRRVRRGSRQEVCRNNV